MSNKKSMKKYELVSDDVKVVGVVGGITLYRIRSLVSFGDIKVGDLGGYIESENNLSHEGTCWVYGNARVYGNALVYGDACVYGSACVSDNAMVSGDAMVSGNARVSGDAWVYDNARVYDNALVFGYAKVSGDACVFGYAKVYGSARVYGNACVYGDARVFDSACVCKDWKVEKSEDILVLGGKYVVTCYLAGDDLDFSVDDFKNNISNSVLISIMTLGNAE